MWIWYANCQATVMTIFPKFFFFPEIFCAAGCIVHHVKANRWPLCEACPVATFILILLDQAWPQRVVMNSNENGPYMKESQ